MTGKSAARWLVLALALSWRCRREGPRRRSRWELRPAVGPSALVGLTRIFSPNDRGQTRGALQLASTTRTSRSSSLDFSAVRALFALPPMTPSFGVAFGPTEGLLACRLSMAASSCGPSFRSPLSQPENSSTSRRCCGYALSTIIIRVSRAFSPPVCVRSESSNEQIDRYSASRRLLNSVSWMK